MRNTIAFIVPCRNKAPWVRETVEAVLNQTYDPMTVVLSDQGSTDGSFDVMKDIAERYAGPKQIRLLQCPVTEYQGMAGYNAHLNWLMAELDEDFIIQTSADDIPHPTRAERIAEAWQAYEPDYIGTKQFAVTDEDRETPIHCPLQDVDADCFVTLCDIIEHRFGGKTSSAWSRRLFEDFGGLSYIDCQDLMVPFWAALKNGYYFIADWLHTYVQRPDQENLGLEGRLRMAEDQAEQVLWLEAIHYQMTSNEVRMLETFERMAIDADRPVHEVLNAEQQRGRQIVVDHILKQAVQWARNRDQMTMVRMQPMAFPV